MINRGLSTLSLSPKQLEHLAYGGEAETVYRYYRALPAAERSAYWNKYVLSQAVCEAIDRADGDDPSAAVIKPGQEAASFLGDFAEYCRNTGSYSLEFFETLERWAAHLLKNGRFEEVLAAVQLGLDAGASRYPAIRVALAATQADSLARIGEVDRAKAILADFAERPYLLIDRDLTPEILSNLQRAALMTGDGRYYKRLIWRNLLVFYTDSVRRRAVTEQITHLSPLA